MMLIVVAVVLIVILAALGLSVFYMTIRIKDISDGLRMLSEKIPLADEIRKQASDTIESLNMRMGSLNQKAEQITSVANEVTNLRNLFIMPKGAGSAGERLLEKALHDILPADAYQTQVRLSAGTVDFAIKFKDCMVPVDSKLSLEDFNKMLAATDEAAKRSHWRSFVAAVKKRIDETSKYILPGEKTTDFALMYIASESVYYEAFVKNQQFGEDNILMEYAIKKRVYPTSPQTIYPYLMTILQGMKALKIEENARDILGKVTGMRNDYERFKSIYNIIIGHIANAYSKHSNDAQPAMTKLEQHIASLEHKNPA
ncbi:MAG: DNA recombination protein RmuC [Candidatus Omnitrophica bacterium]|nr:DNA recombination protein RmuC [Candidatus Omnitrophota bacterium]